MATDTTATTDTQACACGCGALPLATEAQACTCGCACCEPADQTREDEVAELERARDAIDHRLAELSAG